MSGAGRHMEYADKRTPMAWQHRDLNYHQGGYQDKYPSDMDGRHGPPSMSDRLSHHTDKSWRNREAHHYNSGYAPPGPTISQYGNGFPPSHPSFSSGRAASRGRSSSTSSTSTSSTTDESQQVIPTVASIVPPQPVYGYAGYYHGYAPSAYTSSMIHGYPGTLKSSRSVPTLAMGTWDGEPCPVHGNGSLSLPGPPIMPVPGPFVPPPTPMSLPPPHGLPKKAASIYDMRLLPPPPGPMYGTLPGKAFMGMSGDHRSIIGGSTLGPPSAIPPQLLPPMARPRQLVVSEDGIPEPLPVRSSDKASSLPPGAATKLAAERNSSRSQKSLCKRGGMCVMWIIIGVIAAGIILGVMLMHIL